ncbi:MAG: branched-chain amino acid ABC transporter permease [Candidatus Rokuibacteriota bacterium]|nr:MAG: branched-chain amino acid ABC transporter permease [Candidatus Rokubacteria bacterium]
MTFWTIQTLNGLSFGMLLFLLAAGLSLIFGLMRILNLAHGSYYVLGAYVALSVVQATGSLLLATIAGIAAVTVLGILMERLLLRRLPTEELPQALLTFGLLLIIGDLSLWIWGGTPQTLPRPEALSRSLRLGPLVFPSYRLFVIGVGAVVGVLLWVFQERTRLGAMIRAAIDDAEIARATGIDVSKLSTAVFALGAALAALGGIIGGPLLGVYPGADFEILLLAFVVVIIGGLGSLKGALFGGLVVGLLDNFGKALFPELAMFTIFAPMAIILAVRPTGLFGSP